MDLSQDEYEKLAGTHAHKNDIEGHSRANKSVAYDSMKGDLLYDALVEIIDDHMPEVFD